MSFDATHNSVEHASGSLPQFDVTHYGSQLFWLLLCLVVLILFLKFVIIPRVTLNTSERRSYISSMHEENSSLILKNESIENSIKNITNEAMNQAERDIDGANRDSASKIAAKDHMIRSVMAENLILYVKRENEEKNLLINGMRDSIDALSAMVVNNIKCKK